MQEDISPCIAFLCFRFKELVALEEQRNAPQSGKCDQNIDYSAYHAFGAAADPCHQVKLEKSHKTPVQTAYDQQKKRYPIDDPHILSGSFRELPQRYLFVPAAVIIMLRTSFNIH